MIELKEIQRRRRQLNLTQSELAKLSGVSQSALAKIESERMNPSFEIAKRIFEALEQREHTESTKASDIMAKHIITVDASEKVDQAVNLLKKHSISQLPVLSKNSIVGVFSETNFLEHAGEKDIADKKVKDVMGETPPLVPESTPIKTVSELLKFSSIVIITKKGDPVGIIAKADLLKVVK